MQQKTSDHLNVIKQDRPKCKACPAFTELLKRNRVLLAKSIPYFQGSIAEFQTSDDTSDIYNDDGSFHYDPNSF